MFNQYRIKYGVCTGVSWSIQPKTTVEKGEVSTAADVDIQFRLSFENYEEKKDEINRFFREAMELQDKYQYLQFVEVETVTVYLPPPRLTFWQKVKELFKR